jgi:hypothetical protein
MVAVTMSPRFTIRPPLDSRAVLVPLALQYYC